MYPYFLVSFVVFFEQFVIPTIIIGASLMTLALPSVQGRISIKNKKSFNSFFFNPGKCIIVGFEHNHFRHIIKVGRFYFAKCQLLCTHTLSFLVTVQPVPS